MADEIWQAKSFCPEGYVSIHQAIFRAAQFWFPEQYGAAFRAAGSSAAGTNGTIAGSIEALERALSQQFPDDAFVYTAGELFVTTLQRLRNSLHRGTIDAVYFTRDGPQRVDAKFWATTEADGILELGTYWPFGKPTRYEARPNFPLFIKQSQLDALLSEERAGRNFPMQKKSELAAAYRDPTIASLPTRKAQREAIKNLEQFKSYQITDRLFSRGGEGEWQTPSRRKKTKNRLIRDRNRVSIRDRKSVCRNCHHLLVGRCDYSSSVHSFTPGWYVSHAPRTPLSSGQWGKATRLKKQKYPDRGGAARRRSRSAATQGTRARKTWQRTAADVLPQPIAAAGSIDHFQTA